MLNKEDIDKIIETYDEPKERAIARELFKMDQDQLRALLDESIELDELVEWHELNLTVEIWGYDLNNMYDLDVKVKYKEGDEEKLPTEVIEMTDEDGGTIYG